jgi:signal transduction histidine kinase
VKLPKLPLSQQLPKPLQKLITPKARAGSVLGRLMLRMGVLLVLVVGGLVGLTAWLLNQAGDRIQDEFLRRQAAELVAGLQDIPGGPLQMRLANETLNAYAQRLDGYTFMVENDEGRITLESVPMARAYLAPALGMQPNRPVLLDTVRRDGRDEAMYILSLPVHTPRGVYYLTVGQNRTIDDALLGTATTETFHSLLRWAVPLLLLALGIAWLSLRGGINPLYRLSGKVRALDALSGETLPLENVPREVRPLVDSFNTLLGQLTRTIDAQKGLTADTAHQLKTPLAVLQARLEQLDDFKGKELVLKDVQRMSRLVRQLLHYAVLSQHNANLQLADVGETARTVVGSLVPLARQAGVSLAYDGPETPLLARHDAGLLTEAISNLIDNAIRHSPKKGSVEVVVAPLGNRVEIAVHDRGPGIPTSEQALVFSRFWQGPDVPSEGHHGGAGLGLALVAEVMRQHGGQASVSSRTGGGSSFKLIIPV